MSDTSAVVSSTALAAIACFLCVLGLLKLSLKSSGKEAAQLWTVGMFALGISALCQAQGRHSDNDHWPMVAMLALVFSLSMFQRSGARALVLSGHSWTGVGSINSLTFLMVAGLIVMTDEPIVILQWDVGITLVALAVTAMHWLVDGFRVRALWLCIAVLSAAALTVGVISRPDLLIVRGFFFPMILAMRRVGEELYKETPPPK